MAGVLTTIIVVLCFICTKSYHAHVPIAYHGSNKKHVNWSRISRSINCNAPLKVNDRQGKDRKVSCLASPLQCTSNGIVENDEDSKLHTSSSDQSNMKNNDTYVPTKSSMSVQKDVVRNDDATKKSIIQKILSFFKVNWLILGEIAVIYIAKNYPHIGATGGILRPEITISKIGVFLIFFINGIALSISGSPEELQSAYKTNLTIQLYNFAFIPLLAFVLAPMYPDKAFRDGLLVLSCLPCTINICVAQTLAAGGNMGTAIFNAIFANVIGVFLTPLLAIWLLGAGKGVSLLSTLYKLGNIVIVPLILGQICRQTPIGTFAQKISGYSRTLSSLLLLAIVFNIFSDTFMQGIGVSGSALTTLFISMPIVYLSLSALFWQLSKSVLPGLDAPTRGAALFCSSQKTLAFGIPFIKTALGHRPDIAYILAPLLIYAPSQLLLGSSILVPMMQRLIKRGQQFSDGGGI